MTSLSAGTTPRKGRAREILEELVALEGKLSKAPSSSSKRRTLTPASPLTPQESVRSPAVGALTLGQIAGSLTPVSTTSQVERPAKPPAQPQALKDFPEYNLANESIQASDDLVSQVLSLQADLDSARKERQASQDAVEVLERVVDKSKAEAASLQAEAVVAKQAAEVATKEADEAIQEVQMLRTSVLEMERMVQEVKEACRSQEAQSRVEAEALQGQLEQERRRREAAEMSRQELQKELELLCGENANIKAKVRSLQQTLESEKVTSARLKGADKLNRALHEELRQSQETVAEMVKRERDLKRKRQALEAENEGLKSYNGKLMARVKSLESRAGQTRSTSDPEHAEQDETIVKLQIRKHVLKSRVRDLEALLSEAEEDSREAREKYISLGLKVEQLLEEEALTQELVMQDKDRGRITLEEQLEQARTAIQALRERNSVIEQSLVTSDEDLRRQKQRADKAAFELQQSLVRLTHIERENIGSPLVELQSLQDFVEVQAKELRKAVEESASAQQKASALENGFRQLRTLCDELQTERTRSAEEAAFWRNEAEGLQQEMQDAKEEAAQAFERVVTLERLLEDKQVEARLLESKLVELSVTVSSAPVVKAG